MDEAFARLRELMLLRAPSGVEDPMREHLLQVLAAHGEPTVDPAGNVLLRIAGRGRRPTVALAAHLDEIATVVRRVEPDGRVRLGALGDTHPWVWGESVLELLGDRRDGARRPLLRRPPRVGGVAAAQAGRRRGAAALARHVGRDAP